MANLKISEMVAGGFLDGGEEFESVQRTNTRKLTHGNLTALPVSAHSAASYTLILSDQGKLIEMEHVDPNTVTIPNDADVDFPVGTRVWVRQFTTAQTTIAAGSSVIIFNQGTLNLNGEFAEVVLHKRALNSWVVSGNLV